MFIITYVCSNSHKHVAPLYDKTKKDSYTKKIKPKYGIIVRNSLNIKAFPLFIFTPFSNRNVFRTERPSKNMAARQYN